MLLNVSFFYQYGHFVLTVGGHGTGHPQNALHTVNQGDYLLGIFCVLFQYLALSSHSLTAE